MTNCLIQLSLLASLVGVALGHGKLLDPRGFNVRTPDSTIDCVRFTSAQPCGTGIQIPSPASDLPTYNAGEEAGMTWRVANVDGGGPLRAFLDVSGTGSSFSTPVQVTRSAPGLLGVGARGTYPISLRMPDVECQGPNGACLLRVQSPTGFGSCSWIKLAGGDKKKRSLDGSLEKRQADFLDPIGIGDTIMDTLRDPLGQVVNTAQGLLRAGGDSVSPTGNEQVGNTFQPVNLNPLSGGGGGGDGPLGGLLGGVLGGEGGGPLGALGGILGGGGGGGLLGGLLGGGSGGAAQVAPQPVSAAAQPKSMGQAKSPAKAKAKAKKSTKKQAAAKTSASTY
ncbi:uncharacterized protein VTP21DRAFT_11640 [Calcarisporiella thermophila]|uniref:uncharacterized protein n=1 Tax=Calcarisporiella thermophila TaxID=911321 RepID=UPI0037435602